MSDMTRPAAYGAEQLPARLQITATYPATDGSAPESVEVEWSGASFPERFTILAVIDALGGVARGRFGQAEASDGKSAPRARQ